jgi:hypothetical protein
MRQQYNEDDTQRRSEDRLKKNKGQSNDLEENQQKMKHTITRVRRLVWLMSWK